MRASVSYRDWGWVSVAVEVAVKTLTLAYSGLVCGTSGRTDKVLIVWSATQCPGAFALAQFPGTSAN